MSLRAGPDPRRWAVLGWAAIVVSTGAWAAHLVFSAAWAASGGRARAGAGSACRYGSAWPLHLATGITAAVCLVALGVAWTLTRERADASADAGTFDGQIQFLGRLGIGVAAVNLLLILVEGSYVFFLRSCG